MHNSFYFIITFIRSCNFRNADIRTLLIICFLLIKLSITVNILNSIVACTVCIRYQSIFCFICNPCAEYKIFTKRFSFFYSGFSS